ncbi:hypothetical protein POTOM_026697 [Populus tomentosa]|uniref:Uncharacterized protein n=1 Tax=Populus tomentosa TaxID=118781 RepID=A0A8X8CWD3_POPTO|nr:hypothetical protein POTOM_026697 [Populus tomentosa]
MLPDSNVSMEVDGGELNMPSYHSQVHQQMLGVQMCAVGHDSSLDMNGNDYMAGDPSISIKVFSQEANNIDNIKFGNLQQVEKFIPGWSFMNGEDASNEFVGLAALSKDKNEEEMRDDAWERGEGPTVDEVDDKNSAQLGQRFVYVIKVCPRFCRRADFTFMAATTSVNMYV